jgi:hypothetical protein
LPSASPQAGIQLEDLIPVDADVRSVSHAHTLLPLGDPPSPHPGPRRSTRKQIKKVRTAPLTIEERRRIEEVALPSSAAPVDPAINELQLELAYAEDLPQHEVAPCIPGSPDNHDQPPEVLTPPSSFPVHLPFQSPLDSYCKAHQNWFVRLIFLLVAVLHTRHHVPFCACSLLLFTLSLIFSHLSLTLSEARIPFTLDTVLFKLNLED